MLIKSRRSLTHSFRHKYAIKKWRPIIINADKCIQVGLECERCGKRILRLAERDNDFEEEHKDLMEMIHLWDVNWIRKPQRKCKTKKD